VVAGHPNRLIHAVPTAEWSRGIIVATMASTREGMEMGTIEYLSRCNRGSLSAGYRTAIEPLLPVRVATGGRYWTPVIVCPSRKAPDAQGVTSDIASSDCCHCDLFGGFWIDPCPRRQPHLTSTAIASADSDSPRSKSSAEGRREVLPERVLESSRAR
jgi:hypothetical protein